MSTDVLENLAFSMLLKRTDGVVNLTSGHLVLDDFDALFYFKVGEKVWFSVFRIRTSEFGTPKLTSVRVYGCMDLSIELLKKGTSHQPFTEEEEASMQLEDGVVVGSNPESVERWQLKFIEQNRFRLFELAMLIAVNRELDFKNSDLVSGKALKSLLRQIDKRIRQKITPDFLKEVAKIYESAALNNENPIPALMEVYKCSHRRAQEYATLARRAHFLPPTERRVVTVNPSKEKGTRK